MDLEAMSRTFRKKLHQVTPAVAEAVKFEYAMVTSICLLVTIIVTYWIDSNHRRVVRLNEAALASAQEQLKELKGEITRLDEVWTSQMTGREEQIRQVQEQNSELTRLIDQLTSQLRQC
jgi:TolA-binding protein